MKKEYQQPAGQVYASQAEAMLAVSIMDGQASSGTEVLAPENPWTLNGEDSEETIFE